MACASPSPRSPTAPWRTCAAAGQPGLCRGTCSRDALRVAYRLLFVAYAEDRGLLPAGTPAYDSGYSLRALRELAADPSMAWEPDGGYFWGALRSQWLMLRDGVDAGELQIAGFDGGLFDPAKCPLLDDPGLIIGDAAVRDMIDALCWTQPARSINRRDRVGRRRINYRELGVEQLGSIYEGLLSFEPQIAGSPMAFVRLGRGQAAVEQIVDASQVPDGAEILATYPPGTFYLFEATGQRKGSGSFYTPRQLAHFVVGETLRPLTDKATPGADPQPAHLRPRHGLWRVPRPGRSPAHRGLRRGPGPRVARTSTTSSMITSAPPTGG